MNPVDLHVHSTASDGRHTPEELVRMAAEAGLRYFALTDHDTVNGLAAARAAAAAYPSLTFLPGVEISTDTTDGEAHVLGYFIDDTDEDFLVTLSRFRDSRHNRARRMVEKLGDMGYPIAWERVREIAGDGAIGRPHIARAMMENGYISAFEDAFHNFLEHGGPAYVEREKMTPEDAVRLIVRTGGIPVLAHPFTVGHPEAMVASLKPAGLIGLEAYYHDTTQEATDAMLDLATRYGLIVTGGSDYHGDDQSGGALGSVAVPAAAAERLLALGQGVTKQPGGDV